MTSRIGFKGSLIMAATAAMAASVQMDAFSRVAQPYQQRHLDYDAPPPKKLQGKPWSSKKAKKRGRK